MLQFTQSRAVVVGKPPMKFDIATILREPGRYKLSAAILRLAFGVTPRQRMQPVVELLQENETKPKPKQMLAVAGVTAAAATLLAAAVARLRK